MCNNDNSKETLIFQKLKHLSELADDCHKINNESETFLNILDRNYYENYISKILMYAFKNDKTLLCRLIEKYQKKMAKDWKINYSNLRIKQAILEKSMGNYGRADIFIVASDDLDNKNEIIFILENKILSWEHNEQTQKYNDFIEKQPEYKTCKKVYCFLKPDYNNSTPNCKDFLSINYSELLEIFKDNNSNCIIKDFITHIKRYLTKMNFSEAEKYYLKNYSIFNEIANNSKQKFDGIKQSLMSYLKQEFVYNGEKIAYQPYESKLIKENFYADKTLIMWKGNNDTVFHLYKKKEWLRENGDTQNNYYFYAEVKFEDNDPNKIVCQQIVRTYGEGKSFADDYLKLIGYKSHVSHWYVINRIEFLSDKEMLSQEWTEELNKWACIHLKEMVTDTDILLKNYLNWLTKDK